MADGSVQGLNLDRYAPVRAAFEANFTSGADLGASFCATQAGETVVDLWGGHADPARTRAWEKDTIVNVYSTTKTMTALTALLVADRGELDFAQNMTFDKFIEQSYKTFLKKTKINANFVFTFAKKI